MAALQQAIIDIAQVQVGIMEEGGNNQGDAIRKYLDATWFDEETKEEGFPWCAAFVTWVCKEARSRLGLTWKDLNLYIGGAAWDWEEWAEDENWLLLPANDVAEPGDLVTFTFSHIGIVIQDMGDHLITVEGNTNGAGTRDSVTGDGVWRKTRKRKNIRYLIRLPQLEGA